MTQPDLSLSPPRAEARYFRHVNGFTDGTKWIRIDPDLRVYGVAQDGREWRSWTYSAKDVLAKVKDGVWEELPAPALASSSPYRERGEVEHFWTAVARGWDIEPRAYFEKEAVAMGFKSPVEMAVHHMWKRHSKEWPNAELAALPLSVEPKQEPAK